MNLERYEIEYGDLLLNFEFISEGPRGRIHKMVQYEKTNIKGIYNLAFGDKDLHTGSINDTVVSDNGDTEKILATVTHTLYVFTEKYPDTWIHIAGSTHSRTRLYKIGMVKYLIEIQEDFEVHGQLENGWEQFNKSGRYTAFIVKRKK